MSWRRHLARIGALLHRKRSVDDLDEEIRAHIEMEERENLEAGMPPDEAHFAALRRFGNVTQTQEKSREMWSWCWLETLLQDLKYGLRQLRRNPGFTAMAVLTLALGIGVNTGVFSLAEAALYPRFAGSHSSQLAAIYTSGTHRSGYSSSSYPDYVYYREHSRAFSGIAAFVRVEAAWTHGKTTELPWAEVVSGNYFDVLGVKPFKGRFFLPTEDRTAGPAPVVVVSYRFWRTRMESTPEPGGRALMLNGRLFTVVGVAPRDFEGVQLNWGQPPDFWLPMSAEGTFLHGPALLNERQARWCLMVGRLARGVTLANAGSEIRLMAEQLERVYPQADEGRTAIVLPFDQGRIWPTWRQKVSGTLWLLELFAGLVLLVACADVANLLLARGVSRQKEISVRLALGSGRLRVVRQMFTESLLVSLAGAGVGLLLARWLVRWAMTFRQLFTIQLDRLPAALDGRVLAFAVSLAILTALASGLLPSLRVSRLDLNGSLKQSGARSSAAGRHQPLRRLLTVAEVATAFIAMAGAGVLLHTLWRLNSTDLGLNPRHVLSASTEVFTRGYKTAEGIRFYSEMLSRIRALPGVQSAALALDSPLTTMHLWKPVEKVDGESPNPEAWNTIEGNIVSPGYFGTLRIALLRGRDFKPEDDQAAPAVAIVNQTMAQTFWPNADAVGQRLRIQGTKSETEVVGVVADVKQHEVWKANGPMLYQPFRQAFPHSCHLLVRTRGNPMDLLPAVRQQVSEIDPQVPVYGAETLEQVAADSMAAPRMTAALVSFFGGLVLFLAVAGIYGVIAYWVTERTHEIGIRMALGAERRDVLRMVAGQGLKLALIGVMIGIGGALALARFLASMLYGVKPADPLTFITVSLILIVVAVAACYVPARRAAKVDPMVALRYE